MELLDALTLATADFARLLRTLSSTAEVTLGGQWTVRQNAVHVIGSARHYHQMIGGRPSFIRSFEDLEVFNQTLFLAIPEDRPDQLASLVQEAEDSFREAAVRHGPDERVAFHGGLSITAAGLVAAQCNELLMHGWDMAAATGREANAGHAAAATLAHIQPVWQNWFRSDLGDDVTFGLKPDRVPPTVWSFAGGKIARARGEPVGTCSCVTSGSAMSHLLWIGGRLAPDAAGLTVSGERPELVHRFGFPRR